MYRDVVTTCVRPPLKPAGRSAMSVAPTVKANTSLPGEPVVWLPSLPAATTTGMPSRFAFRIVRV